MTVSTSDLAALERQLERVPRGVIDIAARCRCGDPVVVTTAPRLEDGSPFPTMFYLTHPDAVLHVSRLEAVGLMAELTERLGQDEELAASYRRAHEDYIARRLKLGSPPEIDGISAGGMPVRVKCLHALYAHALAAGPGVNPIGDLVVEMIEWSPATCTCQGGKRE